MITYEAVGPRNGHGNRLRDLLTLHINRGPRQLAEISPKDWSECGCFLSTVNIDPVWVSLLQVNMCNAMCQPCDVSNQVLFDLAVQLLEEQYEHVWTECGPGNSRTTNSWRKACGTAHNPKMSLVSERKIDLPNRGSLSG